MSKLHRSRRGETGSAYIVVLLALVVLTIIGLSLVMVTQTEVQLGSNERTIARTIYAADSGLAVATARHLMKADDRPFTYVQNKVQVGDQQIADQVQLSGFQATPVSPPLSDWSTGNLNDTQYVNINYTSATTARRVSWQGSGLPPANPKVLSQSQITAMIRIVNQRKKK